MNGTPKEAKGTPAAPAKARGRRPAPKEAAEAGRVWTGERVTVGEGHPAPPETPSSPPVALIPAGEAKPVPAEGVFPGVTELTTIALQVAADARAQLRSRQQYL